MNKQRQSSNQTKNIIKENEKEYKIEYMTIEGWNIFENLYCKFIEEN